MKCYVKNLLKHWYSVLCTPFSFLLMGSFFIFHIHNSLQIWVSVPQTWKHLKHANQILDWPVMTQVTRDILYSVLIWMAGLILSVKLWHLVDVSVRPTGFFGIVWISPAEIGEQVTCIHIASAVCYQFPVHSPHDIQSCGPCHLLWHDSSELMLFIL